VRLYGTGYPVVAIQEITGCGRTRLMEWCGAYQTHGLDGLRDYRVGGNHHKLTPVQVADLGDKLPTALDRRGVRLQGYVSLA
jgi:transposase